MSEVVSSALTVDSNVQQSHPVVAANGPFFDTITYSKGASLLRMISYTLGAPVMQQGLQQYLKEHQYGNANHEDYFRALTTVCFRSIELIRLLLSIALVKKLRSRQISGCASE